MLTTCPECRTTFRLSHAQLEARRGLVRCGYCRAVFNAYDALLPEFETPAATEPTTSPPPAEAEVEAADSGADFAAAPVLPPPPDPHPENASEPAADRDWAGYERAVADDGPDAEPGPTAPDEDAPDRQDAGDEAFVLHLSGPAGPAMPIFEPPPVMPFAEAPPVFDSPDAILLSELPTRGRIEPRRELGKRLLFGFLSLLLVLALLAQAAYFLRGPLVVWLPELAPGLETACRTLGCRIPVASELAAIRIEATSLETDPEQANRATLRVSFSNRSRTLQAWPHFVLKLTDWKGAPLAQRAFAPTDYLPRDKAALAGAAAMSEHEFHLDLDLGGLSASGYEVIPKYP